MRKFVIEGGNQLNGDFFPVGNKNSVLKVITSSILFTGDCEFVNVPAISDVEVMLQILERMGARVEYNKEEQRVVVNSDGINTHEVPVDLAKKYRASLMFIGPLLARFGKVKSVFPGGDKIGPRELKAHFASLEQMGCEVVGDEWGYFEVINKPVAGEVYMFEQSVTGTENVILAAAGTQGLTTIYGAACEPHVQELCGWLVGGGIEIEGIGSSLLRIRGIGELLRAPTEQHSIWTDYIDVSTAAVAAAITGGEVLIHNVRHEDMFTINFFYDQLGLEMRQEGDKLRVPGGQDLKLKDETWGRVKGVYSQPWYSFPSDLMSVTIILALKVEGSVLFFEKLYPDRMAFASVLNLAGANIINCDPHRIVVNGPSDLKGFNYQSPDLRAGMAYLLAGLSAEGQSEIIGIEHIERGYPETVDRYRQLGASIELVEA